MIFIPRDRDLRALCALAALIVLRYGPDWLRGQTAFWGDLSYIHQPWRLFDAQSLMAGRLPLWNPYLYLGMPQAAGMQDGLYYPGSTPFWLFGFASARAVYAAFHYWLAAALAYLALRALKARPAAAFAGAALFSLGGVLAAREGFLNHLAVLSLSPALFLFLGSPALLALTLAMSFWAGYPTFLAGLGLCAWAIGGAGRRRAWAIAGVAAAALCACLLVPAAELFSLSRRSGGVGAQEALAFAFKPRDLLLWVSPVFERGFDPAVEWWKACQLGFVGFFCAASGALALGRRSARWLAAPAAVAVLILAGSNPISTWLWLSVPGLKFLRYPGNLACLAVFPLSALAAAGLERSSRRLWLAAALCAELLLVSWGAFPRAPRALLSSAGPLAPRLQAETAGHRYLMSPRALETVGGRDVWELRHRLYGLSGAGFKLRSAGNFGEPLVPRANYAFMDYVYSAAGPGAALEALRWADVSVLLSPGPVTAAGFSPIAEALWALARVSGAAGARKLKREPPENFDPMFKAGGVSVEVRRPREDAWSSAGEGAGWLFLSEPLYPGWKVWLETPLGPGAARALPALGPFQKVAVPAGPWIVHWRYAPENLIWGLACTLLSAWLMGAYWYNRLRKMTLS